MIESLKINEFENSLEKLGVNLSALNLAVAISGGGDSMALALLMHGVLTKRGGRVLALTVEHGLRADSMAEAEGVHKLMTSLNIEHRILKWEGDKPETRIEELAREARYNLLLSECKKEGIEYLAIAHNIEDLVETFWIRLSHGSGLDGLSSIAPSREQNGVKIIRPLLNYSRQSLRDICNEAEVKWFEDSSNKDEKFLRVRLRQFEELLQGEGLTSERLMKVITKLEESRAALDFAVNSFYKEIVEISSLGYAKIDKVKLAEYPKDIARRILAKAINQVYPQKYSPSYDLLDETLSEIKLEDFSGKTLCGCELFKEKTGQLIICRESSRIQTKAEICNNEIIWDCRFKVKSTLKEKLYVASLGDEGLAILRKNKDFSKQIEQIPYKIKVGFLSIWSSDNQLLIVPTIGYNCSNYSKEIVIDSVDE